MAVPDPTRFHELAQQTLHARLALMAAQYPERPALCSSTWNATYSQLDAAGNRMARRLMAAGVAPGDRVALLVRHDTPLIGAVVGAFKAGAAVVVLNAADPPARLRQVLEDASPRLVVAEAAHQAFAAAAGAESVLPLNLELLTDGDASPVDVPSLPTDIAFIVYTSGSTGRPKGVMQMHRNVLHNAFRLSSGMRLTPEDRITLLASLGGGQGIGNTWCALATGAALCPFAVHERGLAGFAEWLETQRITVLINAASLFRRIMQTLGPGQRLERIHMVRISSELAYASDHELFRRHFPPGAILLSTYATSETGNITQCPISREVELPAGRLPIGKPAPGIMVDLIDAGGRPVAPGESGEIVVKGCFVSPGYWGNPSLTAQRFGTVEGETPVDPSHARRFFRTGDMGRLLADGTLEFLGRRDAQVKIRGYRIELPEIDGVLAALPQLDRGVVLARPTADGQEQQLVAYVAVRPGLPRDAGALRAALLERLPAYMVPVAFIFLDALPMTSQGKVDYEALRRLPVPAAAAVEEVESATEGALAAMWESVFRRTVGRGDHFFELGGDSLAAAVIAARVHDAFRVDLTLETITAHPTLACMAAHIDGQLAASQAGRAAEAIPLLPRGGALALSFAQERIWRDCKKNPGGFVLANVYRLRGPLHVPALRQSLQLLLQRHEILRTTFHEEGGRGVQVPHDAAVLDFREVPAPAGGQAEGFASRVCSDEARRGILTGALPLLRFVLVRGGATEHFLVRVSHHLVSDAWSWNVFFQELGQVYEATLAGRTPPLDQGPRPHYADYAAWQRRTMSPGTPAWEESVAWWRQALADPPASRELPLRRLIRDRCASASEGVIWWGMEAETSSRLDTLARTHGLTPYMARLAVFVRELAMLTGQDDLVVGAYATNRQRVETQSMFGCFANLLSLRFRGVRNATLRDLLPKVRQVVTDSYAHAEIPYEQVCEALRQGGGGVAPLRPPAIHAIFSMSDYLPPMRLGGVDLGWVERREETMPWGFTLAIDPHYGEARNRVTFDARRYAPAKVRAFLARYRAALEQAG